MKWSLLILLSFICTTLGIPHCQSILEGGYSCVSTAVHTVSIGTNGTDEPHCVTDDTVSCESLYYTLNQINLQTSTPNTTWLVLISSNQLVSSTIQVTFDIDFSCLILCGEGPVNISTSTVLSPVLQLKSKHSCGSVLFYNLTFDFNVKREEVIKESVIINAFQNVILINAFVTKSSDWKMRDVRKNITIISSLFFANHFDRALLDLASPAVYISRTTFKHSLVQLTDNFISPVSIHSHSVTITDCVFTDSEILTEGVLETTAVSAVLSLSNRIEESLLIRITGCTFTESNHLFTSVISIASAICKVHLSDLLFHRNHFESHDSLINIDTDSVKSTVQMENSIFYDNKAIAVNVQSLLEKFIISNSTFEKSAGSIFVNSGKIKSIDISDVSITFISSYASLFSASHLISVENSQISFYGDINIENNVGTAFKASNSYLTFEEWSTIMIKNNTAPKGGGLSLSFIRNNNLSPFIEIKDTATVEFNSNVALLGGAIYIELPTINEVPCSIFELGNVSFVNNTALTKGNDVLFDYGPSKPSGNCTLASYAAQLYYNVFISSIDGSQSHISVFPGQLIQFKSTSSAICEATVYLTCNGHICPSQILPLSGSKVQLVENESIITTDLTVNRNISDSFKDIQFHLSCQSSHKTLMIDVKDCPLGFFFDNVTATCKCCSESICNPKYYQCSLVEGKACIREGYWFGKVEDNGSDSPDDTFIFQCYYPDCLTGSKCQLQNEELFTYTSLPEAQDDQCFFNKGQKLCRQCSDGYHFTYLGLQCVRGTNCGWNLLGLILLAIVINIIIGLLWIGIIKFRGGLTFGISLGPLIFIAFGRLQPYGAFESFEPLQVYFSVLSLFILDSSILGYIPVCTPISTGVGQQLLNYIGPLVIIVMILSIVIVTNCCPRYSNKLFDNPLQVICLLALVTFWSLARTCNSLLLPMRFGNSLTFVIDPNVNIASNYTFIWLAVIPVYIFLYIVIIFMTLSPFLAKTKIFNTVRMKAILDVCQSCYKDKWRWYSSVYFTTWIVSAPLITYPASFSFGAAILIGVTVAHFVFQPYAFNWLNIVDTLLLVDLQILCSIVCDPRNIEIVTNETAGKSTSLVLTAVVYSLSILPVACYALFGAGIVLRRIRACKKKTKSVSGSSDEFYVNVTMSENQQLIRERMEPKDLNISLRSHVMARDSILYDLSM